MAVALNTDGFAVNFSEAIDKRLIVDRVSGTTASLVSLEPNYNYRNMYVWVREEKAFYYLKDTTEQGGATSSDWTKLLSGSGGSSSSIDITEVAFGTGTGITSSEIFTFNNSNLNLLVSTASSFTNSTQSSIIGGQNNGITGSRWTSIQASTNTNICNSDHVIILSSETSNIRGGSWSSIISSFGSTISSTFSTGLIGNSIVSSQCSRIENITSGQFSWGNILNGGFCNRIVGGGIGSSIIGGICNEIYCPGFNLNGFRSSIIGGAQNKICDGSAQSSIIGGICNEITFRSAQSSIMGGCGNTVSGTSSQSSIIGGRCNILYNNSCNSTIIGGTGSCINNSCNSAIIGGIGLTLSNECSVVYVPNLKIASASNSDSSTKILVWDTDNLVKYRESSTLGGVGSISLEPNAGLTNSGTTYATIYNTTVTETTNVPGLTADSTPPPTIGHPLTWLRGLTAGYFSQKNIVEVLDMILFPAVPFAYTAPFLQISSSLPLPSGTVLVNINQYTSDLTLTYNDGNPNATASQYSWLCSVNGGSSYNLIGSVCDSSSLSVIKPSINFPINSPIKYVVTGTVSHEASTICNDTAGNPTPLPLANQAGISVATNPISFCSIFPYYYGRVDCNTNSANFDAGSISTTNTAISCRVSSCAGNNLNIPAPAFNTTQCQKGFLAVPQSLGHQNQVFFNKAVDQSSNITYPINNLHVPITNLVLFGGSSFSVPGVVVNGVSHTYSVYLFQYGSLSIANFIFSCT